MPRKGKSQLDYEDYDDGYGDYYDDYEYGHDIGDDSSRSYDGQERASSFNASQKKQASVQKGGEMWRCSICTFDNPQELESCDICGGIRNLPTKEFIPSSDSRVKNLCKLSGASVLAKSLFASLPQGKLKESRVFQQLDDTLPGGEIDSTKGSENIQGDFWNFQNFFVPSSELRSNEIVPFKFDSLSPDDIVANGKKGGKKDSSVKASGSIGIITTMASRSLQENEEGVTVQILPSKALSSSLDFVRKKRPVPSSIKGGKKNYENGFSLSNVPSLETQLPDGLRSLSLNTDHQKRGKENVSNGLALEAYKPEPWITNGYKTESKQLLHLAVVGHVDAGKSTLMGRLLHILGRVSQKEMHKYEKESKNNGKGSFAYAWVLDESAEERARGITMTVAVAHFETPKFRVVLLDSPGHKDFVPNMISGASQADAAVLVVDASIGAFEAGMEGEGKGGGQTKEHTQLVRSFGVEQIIVAVNKMDAADYSQKRFETIRESFRPFLRHCGFKDSGIKWIPLSAIGSQNLVERPSEARLKSWYSGPNLLEAVDSFEPPLRNVSKPLRLPIVEVMRTHTLGQAGISGKLEGGAIKAGIKVLVMPARQLATIKGIEQDGNSVASARAGESVDVGLLGIEPSFLVPGGVLCHPDYPVRVALRLEVKILILEIAMPILRGSQVVLYCHHAKEPARITELISLLDQKTGAVNKKKPRCLLSHQSAIIEVVPERGICSEEYSNYKALGRVTLRDAGKTLAVGIVSRIIECE